MTLALDLVIFSSSLSLSCEFVLSAADDAQHHYG